MKKSGPGLHGRTRTGARAGFDMIEGRNKHLERAVAERGPVARAPGVWPKGLGSGTLTNVPDVATSNRQEGARRLMVDKFTILGKERARDLVMRSKRAVINRLPTPMGLPIGRGRVCGDGAARALSKRERSLGAEPRKK